MFDSAYIHTGNSAIIESINSIILAHSKVLKNPSPSTLEYRAMVDYNFPHVDNCSRSLPKIANAHLHGDKKLSIKKHANPVTLFNYQNYFKKDKSRRGKVMKRLMEDNPDWREILI